MVSTILSEIKQHGLRITEAKHHHHEDNDNNGKVQVHNVFGVHAIDQAGKVKFYPSVGRELLQEALLSAGQLDDSNRIIYTLSLQSALANGYRIVQFHYFEVGKDYSCVLSKPDCVDLWLPAVSEVDLANALQVSVEVLATSHPLHLTFEKVVKEMKCRVVAFDKHESDGRYSCTLLIQGEKMNEEMGEGGDDSDVSTVPIDDGGDWKLKTFANVTSSHLLDALEVSYPHHVEEGIRLYIENDHWVAAEKKGLQILAKHRPKGLSYEHALKEFGGKIVAVHATTLPDRYSVKVQTIDGLLHSFPGVLKEKIPGILLA